MDNSRDEIDARLSRMAQADLRGEAVGNRRVYDPRRRHPVDMLADNYLRPIAAATGLEVDEAALDQARAYCDEPVLPGFPTPPRRGDWMQTVSGRAYWPLDPRPDDIELDDVAHHLGMLVRFTGAVRRFYSVAQHSVHVFHLVQRHFDRTGNMGGRADRARLTIPQRRQALRRALLHDGPEYVLNDMNRPTKYSVQGYREIEALNWGCFCVRFDLGEPHADIDRVIKDADNAMLLAEQAALLAKPPMPWGAIVVPAEMLADAREIAPLRQTWGPHRAAWEFRQAYEAVK